MKFEEAIRLLINIIFLVSLAGIVLGWTIQTTDRIIGFIIPIGVSLALSGFTGELIEFFGGSFLKKISIPVKIWRIRFSVSAFFITVLIIKLVIFR
jgi:hypothetical protein